MRVLPFALLALVGCAPDAPPAPVQSGLPPRAAGPATPAAAVTRFDGRYVGTVTLNPDRTRACPVGPTTERELVVLGGRAEFSIDPPTRLVLTGAVTAEGDARMADRVDRTIATSGVFSAQGFRGEHRNGLCSYAVLLSKRS